MYSMIIFNSTILYIWKLLREYILKVLIIKKHWNYVWRWMLNKLTVVFILQYIHTSNVYVAYLKLAQCYKSIRASLVAQRLKHLPGMQETWVRSLGWADPLEKEMAIHSSTLAWRIPWREEPGRLQSMGLQRAGHDWVTSGSGSYFNKQEHIYESLFWKSSYY